MKDLSKKHAPRFQSEPSEALAKVRVALDYLWEDETKSIHEKVAGDFDYEELIVALLSAESALSDVTNEPDPA